MSISYSKPRTRLRFILLAALAVVALALLAAPGGSGPLALDDAFAHNSCSNDPFAPNKTAAGRIHGSNKYTCTSSHATTMSCAVIAFDNGTGFAPIDEPNCKSAQNSTSTQRAHVSAPCGATGWYRTQGAGEAGNAAGQVPHTATDLSGGQWIQCTPNDLTSTGGVFEDLDAILR